MICGFGIYRLLSYNNTWFGGTALGETLFCRQGSEHEAGDGHRQTHLGLNWELVLPWSPAGQDRLSTTHPAAHTRVLIPRVKLVLSMSRSEALLSLRQNQQSLQLHRKN